MRKEKREKLSQRQQQKLAKIISKCYNKQQNALNLWYSQDDWIQILQLIDCSKLARVRLNNCQITNNDIKIIIKVKWTNLISLSLDYNKIGYEGIKNLGNTNIGMQLKILDLSWNPIKDKGIKYLHRIQFPILQNLYVGGCKLGRQGLKTICKSKIPNLKFLRIQCNNLSFEGYATFSSYNNFKKLKNLTIFQWIQQYQQWNQNFIEVLNIIVSQCNKLSIDLRLNNNQFKNSMKLLFKNKF